MNPFFPLLVFYLINIEICWINLEKLFIFVKILEKIIFVSKNWFNDPRVGCKFLCNLVEFNKMDEHLKNKLEKFEDEFERDEIWN
jgi:hypothetical protein